MIDTIKNGLKEGYPDFRFDVQKIEGSGSHEIVEVIVNGLFSFRQITNIDLYEDEELTLEEKLAANAVEIVRVHLDGYKKLDRELVIKEKKTIMFMNQMEPTSFHALKEDELLEKMREYEIKEEEFKKKEA